MTDIIIIAAVAKNGVIGRKNDIPWRISEDFQRFRRITMGFPCIMGDSTYQSLPDKSRPLPGRENIVLTLDRDYKPPGVTVFNDFKDAIFYVRGKGVEAAFITGGATIYRLGLEVADYMELTFLNKEFDGDVFFPEYDDTKWELMRTSTMEVMDQISLQPVIISYKTFRRKNRNV
jgi:dihydrofolate reductase